ncbi:hypothetical protein SAMN06265222_1441 [Neorhodopirellula lusitana]|uniref:DUF6985 domain-containing protein n=1 Tax=Neorhodopirellula lusitana TaxID=445327 RepID=A0ABY1QV72_9BACT|nr:hypothetical protein [Neorhodopirellula lusitana]SMP80088.1 hypothetical protein SAMN06265222_1441 [Neorhodopirellula lusitana]
MAKWTHPDIGVFTFCDYAWVATCTLPAFKAFRYRPHSRNVGRTKLSLKFNAEDEDDVPSKKAVTVAKRIVKNQASLVRRIKKAIFDDVHGAGPDSGMWWHGDINSIADSYRACSPSRKSPVISSPDDFDLLLATPEISIRKSVPYYDNPIAEIGFYAVYDAEHGVGVLTDGNRVLGIGYEYSVMPFNRP